MLKKKRKYYNAKTIDIVEKCDPMKCFGINLHICFNQNVQYEKKSEPGL